MQESNREEGRTNEGEKDRANQKPDSDATSKETLADLEKSEKSSDAKSERATGESQMPSPDGILDETRDKDNDAGPM